jgi:hypothetical protein
VIFLKIFSWAVVVTHLLSALSLTFLECVVTRLLSVLSLLLPIGLATHFYKGPSSTSVKPFLNVSAQPQLLEVEGPGDVGVLLKPNSVTSCVLVLSSRSFLTFLWLLYSCENWIDLNRIPLSLHLKIKPQIGLYISILGSLHSCTILTFQYHHPRAYNFLSVLIIQKYSYHNGSRIQWL